MTQENFIAEYKALKAKKQEIEDRVFALNVEYIKSLPFKVGDCVRLYNKFGKLVIEKAWITSIEIYSFGPTLNVKFVRPKKDGTKSRREERVWWGFTPENVELLNDESC